VSCPGPKVAVSDVCDVRPVGIDLGSRATRTMALAAGREEPPTDIAAYRSGFAVGPPWLLAI
jgi:hypothetical protein